MDVMSHHDHPRRSDPRPGRDRRGRARRQARRAGLRDHPSTAHPEQCVQVSAMFDDDVRFRSTVVMARHAFGEGRYRYFADPLPELVQTLRVGLYPPLARIANAWADRLGEPKFPRRSTGCSTPAHGWARRSRRRCSCGTGRPATTACTRTSTASSPSRCSSWSSQPTRRGLHRRESVFVEQRPRQQSRPMVARPGQGQAVIFPVATAPRGARGDHRVQMRHGVSAVHTGSRDVLGDHLPQRALSGRSVRNREASLTPPRRDWLPDHRAGAG